MRTLPTGRVWQGNSWANSARVGFSKSKGPNEQQEKLAKKDQRKLLSSKTRFTKFGYWKEIGYKKEVEQTASQSLLEKEKEVQALENQLATLRLGTWKSAAKTLPDLEKERDQVTKNQSGHKKKKTSFLWLLLQNHEVQLRSKMSKLSSIRTSRPNSRSQKLGAVCESEFNKVKVFPNAYFEKWTTWVRGSGRRLIFRECDEMESGD